MVHVAWHRSLGAIRSPWKGAETLAECIAFCAPDLECSVGGANVLAQPGGFYGGWITPELTVPFKGEPGSGGW
jgi:hypothetical protein